jgi:hypothetical protein
MLKTICYVSSQKNSLKISDLNNLFNSTKINNTYVGISGILIYKSGNFLQILEGDVGKVDRLYQKILLDNRHHSIIMLIDTEICDRIFESYNTEFPIIENNRQIHKLKLYLNWLKYAELQKINKLITIIENFVGVKVLTAI